MLCYFSREKPLVKPTAPWSPSHIICLCDLFYLPFIFRSIKPKIQKYLAAIYFIWRSIYQYLQLSHVCLRILAPLPERDWQPLYPSGCEYLLFVCRGCLRCVAWFSYWFDNLGFISKGNTYHMLFFSREATSEIYGPRFSSLSYFPSRSIFICFYFQIY